MIVYIHELKPGSVVMYSDLMANVHDDGRFFWAYSFDNTLCCSGMIVDYEEWTENPKLQVNDIWVNKEKIEKKEEINELKNEK